MLVSYGLVKLSIILFYRRLFVVGKTGAFNFITVGVATVVGLWTIAFLCVFIFGYRFRFTAHWGTVLGGRSYRFSFKMEEAMAASDLVLDIFVFFLPFPPVRAHRPLREPRNQY